jgi:hypothetical protein
MQSSYQTYKITSCVARTKILVALPKSSKVSPFITEENGSWRNTCSKTLRTKEWMKDGTRKRERVVKIK